MSNIFYKKVVIITKNDLKSFRHKQKKVNLFYGLIILYKMRGYSRISCIFNNTHIPLTTFIEAALLAD